MNLLVRRLFQELADIPRAERDRILAEREVAPDVRAEVESLLSFDSAPADSLTDRVSHAAEEALRSSETGELNYCGPYRLVRLLGSGGMGAVYLAERSDGEIQQQVAIKLLRADADRPVWHERFLRERQLLASLNHPSIARVMDAGHTSEGRPYLVIEYIDGVPIDEYAAPLHLRDQLTLFLRVCDGVSHAHRQLIIHRDLKPSNILVDASGQPKLLDFGIAKLLHETRDATQTVDRLLTPNYASPEQVCGGIQTTATDVYSLGCVLYKLLTGRSPNEQDTATLRSKLPSDIDYILRKALRFESEERYTSVEGFASDVRAFLEWRPVQARSGDTWYRTRKFLRRHRVPVIAASLVMASLSAGLWLANRERAVAQHRFQQVRQLANKVLALDTVIQGIPGSTKARHEIVAMSQEYLEALGGEAAADNELALEIGVAYFLLANAQGVPTVANLGQYAQAGESLRKADALLEPVLAVSPEDRKVLLTTAEVANARMILADVDNRDEEVVTQGRKASGRLERLFALGAPSQSETARAAQVFYNMALAHKNGHLYDDAARYARRGIEIARPVPSAQRHVGRTLSIVADLQRLSGDLEGALKTIRESQTSLEKADFPSEPERRSTLYSALWREGCLLGEVGDINLGRPDEAVAVLQRALDLPEELAKKDADDARSRILVASASRELGAVLSERYPQRALAVYNHGLLRLGEIRNSVKARRDETHLLAGSSYALRRLNRISEAKDRIDAAFLRLRDTKDYPSDRVEPGAWADTALRALGDHFAETGEPQRAAETYTQLLNKIVAYKIDPQNDLRHAVKLSGIHAALASLHRRNGRRELAEASSALHLELWRHWDRKLPNNDFVRRQLQKAAVQEGTLRGVW